MEILFWYICNKNVKNHMDVGLQVKIKGVFFPLP